MTNKVRCAGAMLTLAAIGGLSAVGLGRGGGGKPTPRGDDRPFGIPPRQPWTTSHITGSPDPPHPYRVERVFPKLTFKNPLLMTAAPGTSRFFVGEQAGILYSFPNDQACAKADVFLDLTTAVRSWNPKGKVKGVGAVYSLAFHPQFARNHYCYVCYVLDSKTPGEQLPDGSRISRFTVTNTDPPRCDPKSEKVLLTWLAGGHNGCCLQFGLDGYLYISTGDGTSPNPPDALDTGQDLSDLLSSILRIDVDHAEAGRPYRVPPDNPFVHTAGARPEIWAYGFRNPWRMSFDRATGDLWVGDVGWELWEMVYRVRRGGNYGWSVMEGRQPVRPNSRRGPTPILPPALDFPHTEAASITGGYVYRGKRYKELVGAYICGDWVTRKLWATRFDATDRILWHKEIAQGTQRVVSFAEDHDGELYFVNYDDVGTLHQLVPNEHAAREQGHFPRRLSDTGLFTSVKDHVPAPGVFPFSVNVEQWADGATAQRLVAVPGQGTVQLFDSAVAIPGGFYSGQVFFPKDAVLARTMSLELERGNPASRRRLETQVVHNNGTLWHAYTYRWNDAQTDADLVPAAGDVAEYAVIDPQAPGGRRRQTWHFHSRAECLTCHNPWGGYALAFTEAQLDRSHDYGGVTDSQLRALEHAGVIARLHHVEGKPPVARTTPAPRLVNPYDPAADLNERARSYLHVNCAHCHQLGAGGTADMDLRYTMPLEQGKTLEVHPVQGTFGIAGAQILAPGDPYRSVLYYRIGKLGRGRMPHLGSDLVDERGVRLIHDWIRRLPVHKAERDLVERLTTLDEPAILAQEQAERARRVRAAAVEIARAHGRQAPVLEDEQAAERQERTEAPARARSRATERGDAVRRLLGSTSSALVLAHALAEGRVPASVRTQVLAAAVALPDPQVRDVFERFVPEGQRVQRLGSVIKPEQVLDLKGDVARGRALFFQPQALQCLTCHRVAGKGSTLGPDLSQIGKKYTRAQILENILEPSKTIEPQYQTYLLETTDGQLQTGLLVAKSGKEVVVRTAQDKEVRVPAGKVASLSPVRQSLMPEQALRDLTAQEAADLLEFLASLK